MAISQGLNSILLENPNDDNLVYSDRDIFGNIVFSLIDNAIKYANKDTSINIGILKNGSKSYKIKFENYGLLIKKEEVQKIFNRNYRSLDAIKRNPHGSGVGLYVAKKFSNLLGGDCFVEESNRTNGTVFTLELPNTIVKNKVI